MQFCHTNHIILSVWLLAALSDSTEWGVSHIVGQREAGES